MTWLAGFEQKAASVPGGTFDGSPIRLVLHTTEGASIEGAVAAFAATGSWPHFTVDPVAQRKQQHYPLTTSARALAHPKGSPETNRAGAIQVEIVGYAKDSHNWPADVLEWLGREVVEPIHNALDFNLTHPPFVGVEHGTIATVNAAQRFTWAEWADFNGVCGHQHVPGNDHWDPGRLDMAHIVASVNAPPEEDDMIDPNEWAQVNLIVHALQADLNDVKARALTDIEREALFGKTNGLYAKVTALQGDVDRIITKLGA